MPLIHHPALFDNSYPPSHGPVLLLSCMDPRLLDDAVEFMNHDNLCNRYDHITLAGAALGALGGCKRKYSHWKKTFFDHLAGACDLHKIEEVYILEHRACGAYHKIFKVAEPFGDSQEEQAEEAACHLVYAKKLEVEIEKWGRKHKHKLKVKSFLMDLRGRVSFLV